MRLKNKLKRTKRVQLIAMLGLQNLLLPLFIFLIPTQLAYHFWPSWSYIFGIGIDYLAPAVYLSDIVLLLLLSLWLIESVLRKPHFLFAKNKIKVGFLLFSAFNILVAKNWMLSMFAWMRIWMLIGLVLYLLQKKIKLKEQIFTPLAFSIITFGLIGIIQFIYQSTLGGVLYYLGERDFRALTPGIALVGLWGKEYLRVYSTFPHPNVLAGYLGVSGILLLRRTDLNHWLKNLCMVIGGMCLLLTFSKSAIISLIAIALIVVVNKKIISLTKLTQGIFLLVLALSISAFFFLGDFYRTKDYPEYIASRLSLISVNTKMLKNNLSFGVGLNNFVYELPRSIKDTKMRLIIQPVHNIYLLLLTEVGIFAFILFTLIIFRCLRYFSVEKNYWNIFAIIFIMMTGLFDHYWITINQTRTLMAIVIGLSLKNVSRNKL